MSDPSSKSSAGSKRRVARFRTRERERERQVAIAVARIVNGRPPGDAAGALAAYLVKIATRPDTPPEHLADLEQAARMLSPRVRSGSTMP